MSARFEALREALLKGGVAPWRVRRYLAELDDHLADLTEGQRAAGCDQAEAATRARSALGDDAELAEAMLAEPTFRSWAVRAPWVVFGLLPPLAVLAVSFLAILALFLVAKAGGAMTPHSHVTPPWFRQLAKATVLIANLIIGPLVAVLLVIVAHRQRLRSAWPLLGLAILVLLLVRLTAEFPALPHHNGTRIGIGLPFIPPYRIGAAQGLGLIVQILLTLSPALWLAWKARSRAV